MALIVRIFINEREIKAYKAVRIVGQPHEQCTYRLSSGAVIQHHYDDGAEALAAKVLLDTLTSRSESGITRDEP